MNILMQGTNDEDTLSIEIYTLGTVSINDLVTQFISFARSLGYADSTVAYAMADHDFVRSFDDDSEEPT